MLWKRFIQRLREQLKEAQYFHQNNQISNSGHKQIYGVEEKMEDKVDINERKKEGIPFTNKRSMNRYKEIVAC